MQLDNSWDCLLILNIHPIPKKYPLNTEKLNQRRLSNGKKVEEIIRRGENVIKGRCHDERPKKVQNPKAQANKELYQTQKTSNQQEKVTEMIRAGSEIKNKVSKIFESLKKKHPEVFQKCENLWKKKEGKPMKIQVEDIESIFPKVFRKELGCLKGVKASIPIPESAVPKFFKPRPVPYALRSRVENELDKLEGQKVWKKVKYSRWAAPIVVVLKDKMDPSGPIRICG